MVETRICFFFLADLTNRKSPSGFENSAAVTKDGEIQMREENLRLNDTISTFTQIIFIERLNDNTCLKIITNYSLQQQN